LLLLPGLFLFGAANTLSISDLQVNSANPKYEFIGKGITELISFELSKSKGITLVEREKRTQMLEEMEFSLSDLTDTGRQLEVGRLLSARFIIFGELIDMDSIMLISLRMIEVETGQVVWREKLNEPLANYSYISGFFAKSILDFMKVDVAQSTVAVTEEKVVKDEEAAIALSNAIDSYDKKDTSEAKKSLAKARKLDPENKVVDLYLQKLSPTSAKYKVQLENFGPSGNPAVLGVIRQDRIYLLGSEPTDMSSEEMKTVGDDFIMGEMHTATRIGMEVPLGERLGIALEFAFSSFDNKTEAPFTFDFMGELNTDYFHDREVGIGGALSLGYLVVDWLSVGAGVHVYHNTIWSSYGDGESVWDTSVQVAGDLGFLIRRPDNSLVFDLHSIYAIQKEYYLDTVDEDTFEDNLPLILEGTLTAAFLERRLFGVFKGLGDIYYGRRQGFVARVIPVAAVTLPV